MEKSLIFWLDGPPVCCKGVFDAVANLWNGEVYYILTRKIDKNRAKIIGESNNKEAKAKYIFLSQMNNPEEVGVQFLKEYSNDIHVFNGYMSASSFYLNKLLVINKNANTMVWAERPCPTDLKKSLLYKSAYQIVHKLRHRLYAYKLGNKISALLPLGNKGVKAYCSNGWEISKVFPFIYLPTMNEKITFNNIVKNKIRFVYLGRFSSGWKGTDVLLDACKKLKGDNYTLTMVGGYGDYKEQTFAYIEQNPHLEFGGTWKIDEACDRLSEYDVCIVPSRFEGWNVTVNEALMAGIGCIVTDEAVSDELVSASRAGMVVKAGDSSALANAMENVMKNPELVLKWKKAAYDFRPNMTAEANAKYFISIINYLFGNDRNSKPTPPWQG